MLKHSTLIVKLNFVIVAMFLAKLANFKCSIMAFIVMAGNIWKNLRTGQETASAQAWSIKKRWASKFEEFLRTSSAGHLAVSLIRGDCVYSIFLCTYIITYLLSILITSG